MYSTVFANLFLPIEFSSQISLKRIEPVEQAFEVTDLLGFRLVRLQFPVQQSVTREHVGINYKTGRGRNTGFPVPPAQIRTCTLMHPAPALASDGKT